MKVLQDQVDILKVAPGPCSEAHVAGSHIKIEEYVSMDVQEEKDPLLIPFPFIKTEQEVSCMSVCTVTFRKCLLSSYIFVKIEIPNSPE
jgi:hypothetical protein